MKIAKNTLKQLIKEELEEIVLRKEPAEKFSKFAIADPGERAAAVVKHIDAKFEELYARIEKLIRTQNPSS